MSALISHGVLTTEDSITLCWDKPEREISEYLLRVDGVVVKAATSTHFELEDLEPDTEYEIRVFADAEPFIGPLSVRTAAGRRRVDITAAPYFAAGDGMTLCTAVIQRAVDELPPGETLYIPRGTFLTGAISLKSDMELYLDEGAVLKGSTDPADYLPLIPSRFEGIERMCLRSLINIGHMDHSAGVTTGNVTIRGRGTIEGGGRALQDASIRFGEELGPEGPHVAPGEDFIPGRVRGRLINMSNAGNVRLSGITLKNGPCWNIHMIYCDGIVTDHCRIISEDIDNGDGWDPDSSAHCTVFATYFDTSDDAIAIKSGKNPEGLVIARPSEQIRIFDCVSVSRRHGFAIGSEMSGGVSDVSVWDSDLSGCPGGFEIKTTMKRGGYVRDVTIRDSVLTRVRVHTVPYNDDGEGAGEAPRIDGIDIKNITLTGSGDPI